MYHLPGIADDYRPHRPQIWWLSHPKVAPGFDKRARAVEEHWKTSLDAYRFSHAELETLIRPPADIP